MSTATFIAKPLKPSDRNAWDDLASRHGSIFDSLAWTDLFEPSLCRMGIHDGGGVLRGGFSVWEERRFGQRIRRNPPYTPEIGPFFESRTTNPSAQTNEQRAVVEVMAGYLTSPQTAITSLALSPAITDAMPFYWRGWKVVPNYTYRIDLRQGEDALLAAMSARQRSAIRKAGKDCVHVCEMADTHDLRALVVKTFARQNKPFPSAAMDAILNAFPPGRNSYCFISRQEGVPIAGMYVLHDSRSAYNLMAGYDDVRSHSGAGPLAMWAAIRKAREIGLTCFDFEGSMVPAIERYYRGFGGRLTPYHTIHRAWPWVEMGLKLMPQFRNRF